MQSTISKGYKPISSIYSKVQSKLNTKFVQLIDFFKMKSNYVVGARDNQDFGELDFYKSDDDYAIVKEIIDSYNEDPQTCGKVHFTQIDKKVSRAMATFMCAGIGDALGTHMEFEDVVYNKPEEEYLMKGFKKGGYFTERCNLGEFSDDTSMALCLADSILACDYEFDGADQMIKYINWWHCSFNNCTNPRTHSFGLGGNIKGSLKDFVVNASQVKNLSSNLKKLPQKCLSEDNTANGNGSIMRLAPVPIAFASNPDLLLEKGKDFARKQSKVTHTGNEAAECCALLTHLIIKNISRGEDNVLNFQEWVDIALSDFETKDYSVECLKNSKMEDEEVFNERVKSKEYLTKFTKSTKDRDWNWKDKNFIYSPTREGLMPGYIGSYTLDALAMALHISYYNEPKKAILYASNMGGDCDTVAAIVGEIVGSFYGLDSDIIELYHGLIKFDNYKCAYMAYKLYNGSKNKFENPEGVEDINKI